MSRSHLAAVAALLGLAAPSTPHAAFAQEGREVHVVVDNQGYYDMHVYVLDGGTRRSLGLATGLSKREFTLPQIVVDSHRDVRILADPIGGRNAYVSQTLLAGPGDWITVVIRDNPNLSYTSVSEYEPNPDPTPEPSDSAQTD